MQILLCTKPTGFLHPFKKYKSTARYPCYCFSRSTVPIKIQNDFFLHLDIESQLSGGVNSWNSLALDFNMDLFLAFFYVTCWTRLTAKKNIAHNPQTDIHTLCGSSNPRAIPTRPQILCKEGCCCRFEGCLSDRLALASRR